MRIYFLMAAVTVLFACRKEATLTPETEKPLYTLPQGNHDFDNTIVSLHKKYGTYFLYKFTQSDYAYNYIDRKSDSAFNGNPAYVDTVLRFFKAQLMDQYPESFLQKSMPFKVLLASYIGAGTTRSATGFSSTSSMLAIGWTDSTLVRKTPAELKRLRSLMHRFYMERAYRVKTIEVPAAFVELVPTVTYAAIGTHNQYQLGVVEPPGSQLNLATDFLGYIQAITSNTKAQLEAGLLSSRVDTRGVIRKKYEIVLHYFLTVHQVDLQSIGELP